MNGGPEEERGREGEERGAGWQAKEALGASRTASVGVQSQKMYSTTRVLAALA